MIDIIKYPRTYHFAFSPGTTSDDRISQDIQAVLNNSIVMTEKMDGENTLLCEFGIYSRSIATPTTHPWSSYLKPKWELWKNDLKDLYVYGENLYAVHSIEYDYLKEHFFIFAVRDAKKGLWLSWSDVVEYAKLLDYPTVPVLRIINEPVISLRNMENIILEEMSIPSRFAGPNLPMKEGVVIRTLNSFNDENFKHNVIKWVRKNHVQTDQFWRKNWKRAKLNFEKPIYNIDSKATLRNLNKLKE